MAENGLVILKHDSVIHKNVLKFSHTCQFTVLNFSGILHWLHRLLSPLHIRPKLCCVVAVVLDIQCGEEKISVCITNRASIHRHLCLVTQNVSR